MDPTVRLLKELVAIDSVNPSLVPGAAGVLFVGLAGGITALTGGRP